MASPGEAAPSAGDAPAAAPAAPPPAASLKAMPKLNAAASVFVPRASPPTQTPKAPSVKSPAPSSAPSSAPPSLSKSAASAPPPSETPVKSPVKSRAAKRRLKLAVRLQAAKSAASNPSGASAAPRRTWASIVTAPPRPKQVAAPATPAPASAAASSTSSISTSSSSSAPASAPTAPAPTLASIVAKGKPPAPSATNSTPKPAPPSSSAAAEAAATPKVKKQSSNKPSKAPLSLAEVIARQMEHATPAATMLDVAVVSYAKQKQKRTPANAEIVKKRGLVRNPNLADTSAPVIFRRGKERETPKAKKPSRVKRLVLLERLKRAGLLPPVADAKPAAAAAAVVAAGEATQAAVSASVAPSESAALAPTAAPAKDAGGKGKKRAGNSPASSSPDKGKLVLPPASSLPPGPTPRASNEVREYCDHALTPELDGAVSELLGELKRFHDRAMAKDQSKAKRRFVSGLREVLREVKAKNAKSVVIAPNIEECKAEGGLDETLSEIIRSARSGQIPVVFALSRNKLGRVLGKHVRISAVAVLSYDGAQDKHKRVLDLARAGREERKKQLRDAAKAAAQEGTAESKQVAQNVEPAASAPAASVAAEKRDGASDAAKEAASGTEAKAV